MESRAHPDPTPEASGGPLRFALRAVVFVLPVLVWQGLSLAAYLTDESNPYNVLVWHQTAKLVPNDTVETILIGDSSLGNGIDVDLFSAETGSPTLNLAMSGLDGYGGPANMLARASGVYPNLKNVVVMNTPEMISRPPAARGLVFTVGTLDRFGELDAEDTRRVLSEALDVYFSQDVAWHLIDRVRGKRMKYANRFVDGDYIRQSERRASPSVKPLAPEDVDTDKARVLAKMVRYAQVRGLNTVYVHGPMWEEQVRASGAYLDAAERAILATGVTFVPGAEPIPSERLGDTADHVAPAFRAEVTVRYARRLRPHLR